jgi:hypothetical protein
VHFNPQPSSRTDRRRLIRRAALAATTTLVTGILAGMSGGSPAFAAEGTTGAYATADRTVPVPSVTLDGLPRTDPWDDAAGVPITITFNANGASDVVAYEYRALAPHAPHDVLVDAGVVKPSTPSGPAKATFTPPEAGHYRVYARSIDSAGNRSEEAEVGPFVVNQTAPWAWSRQYLPLYTEPTPQGGGVGVPDEFTLAVSGRLPDVASIRYRLNDGPTQTVVPQFEAGDQWTAKWKATVTLAPDRSGLNVLHLQSVRTDGRTSIERTYEFLVAAGA